MLRRLQQWTRVLDVQRPWRQGVAGAVREALWGRLYLLGSDGLQLLDDRISPLRVGRHRGSPSWSLCIVVASRCSILEQVRNALVLRPGLSKVEEVARNTVFQMGEAVLILRNMGISRKCQSIDADRQVGEPRELAPGWRRRSRVVRSD